MRWLTTLKRMFIGKYRDWNGGDQEINWLVGEYWRHNNIADKRLEPLIKSFITYQRLFDIYLSSKIYVYARKVNITANDIRYRKELVMAKPRKQASIKTMRKHFTSKKNDLMLNRLLLQPTS